jgi:hypothetical protein
MAHTHTSASSTSTTRSRRHILPIPPAQLVTAPHGAPNQRHSSKCDCHTCKQQQQQQPQGRASSSSSRRDVQAAAAAAGTCKQQLLQHLHHKAVIHPSSLHANQSTVNEGRAGGLACDSTPAGSVSVSGLCQRNQGAPPPQNRKQHVATAAPTTLMQMMPIFSSQPEQIRLTGILRGNLPA